MNHNFLPFEVTELLPKENPYNNGFIYANTEEVIQLIHYCNLKYGESVNRNAWTIIDALTWLLDNYGVFIYVIRKENYKTMSYDNQYMWCIVFKEMNKNEIFSPNDVYYTTLNEAYIAGIKHCLNLIKNEILT